MAETRFEGSGPVARYWLTRCEGFAVRGGRTGVVESMIREADPHATAWLVVRTRGRRRQTVSVDEVSLVDPAERVLVVAAPARRPHAQRVRAATATTAGTVGRQAQAARLAAVPLARTGAQRVRAATSTTAHTVGPHARTGATRLRTASSTGARAVVAQLTRGWRAFAASARVGLAQLTHVFRRSRGRRLARAGRAVTATARLVVETFVHSFRSLAAEARYPKPYAPAKRSARRRTSSDAGNPTTFR